MRMHAMHTCHGWTNADEPAISALFEVHMRSLVTCESPLRLFVMCSACCKTTGGVQLSALGAAISVMVTLAETLKSKQLAVETRITTSPEEVASSSRSDFAPPLGVACQLPYLFAAAALLSACYVAAVQSCQPFIARNLWLIFYIPYDCVYKGRKEYLNLFVFVTLTPERNCSLIWLCVHPQNLAQAQTKDECDVGQVSPIHMQRYTDDVHATNNPSFRNLTYDSPPHEHSSSCVVCTPLA